MIQLRRKEEIFHVEEEWFSADWHFSFDGYVDPENTLFGTLRVFNVDTLIPGAVWPMHPHRDIEVITYCVAGAFEHADSLGHDGVLWPGDVQHTTVGSGVEHSEINHSDRNPMTFIQVWILPWKGGLTPHVEQRHIRKEERLHRFLPVVSNRSPGALPIEQNAEAYAAALTAGDRIDHRLEPGDGIYFYVISGAVSLNGQALNAGDAAKVREEPALTVEAAQESELFMVGVTL
ncbi:MAG: pirin family protein [Candidatus Manganitrophus sp.]|nr:pirin family protein [Candidatus Manganitrophus sp.]WDT70854.1 MAG: pirin family protein [Candidatus Manganitrophus sp.]WDT81876.1 MAG: pirin family protein [Candidatus Manganitrophus sp.]